MQSETSDLVFCDDIFGETPAGVRKSVRLMVTCYASLLNFFLLIFDDDWIYLGAAFDITYFGSRVVVMLLIFGYLYIICTLFYICVIEKFDLLFLSI